VRLIFVLAMFPTLLVIRDRGARSGIRFTPTASEIHSSAKERQGRIVFLGGWGRMLIPLRVVAHFAVTAILMDVG
jgi:hypothetical protein